MPPCYSIVNGQERDMRKRSTLTICLVTVAAIALSIVTNIATNNMPHRFRPPSWSVWITLAILAALVVSVEVRSSRHNRETDAVEILDDKALSAATAVLAQAVRDQWQ